MDVVTTRFVAVAVTVVWSASTLAAIFLPDYHPPVEMHAIMGLVAGALFGRQAITRIRENGNSNGSN